MQSGITMQVSKLHASSLQPRKKKSPAADRELAESVKAHGVLQPLLVTVEGEIICGHRRWAAAKAAGLKEVPVAVSATNAAEFIRAAQLIENGQREDLDPIDEGNAIEVLLQGGKPAAEIAAELGRSETYVLKRSRLGLLPETARKAIAEGMLTLGAAEVIARLPPELQEKATKAAIPDYGNSPFSVDRVRDIVASKFLLALASAPFSQIDPDLVAGAGPCSTCPKQTGSQRALFDDVEDPNLCTDGGCFAKKKAASWKAETAAAKRKGLELLTEAASAKVFGYDRNLRLGYVKPTDKPKGSTKTWKAILGDAAPAPLLAKKGSRSVQVYRVEDLTKAAKAAGIKLPKAVEKAAAPTSIHHDDDNITEKRAFGEALSKRLREEFARAVEGGISLVVWQVLLENHLPLGNGADRKAYAAIAAGTDLAAIQKLIVMTFHHRAFSTDWQGKLWNQKGAARLLASYGLDLKKITAEVKKARAEEKPKAKKPKAKRP